MNISEATIDAMRTRQTDKEKLRKAMKRIAELEAKNIRLKSEIERLRGFAFWPPQQEEER